MSAAGDVNGDGIADLLIGADNADIDGQYDTGESYVLFERAAIAGNGGRASTRATTAPH